MAKKDLRNGKESRRWKPSKWSFQRAARMRHHALDCAHNELCVTVGPFSAALVRAEILAAIDAAISRAAVHAAGFKTLGE